MLLRSTCTELYESVLRPYSVTAENWASVQNIWLVFLPYGWASALPSNPLRQWSCGPDCTKFGGTSAFNKFVFEYSYLLRVKNDGNLGNSTASGRRTFRFAPFSFQSKHGGPNSAKNWEEQRAIIGTSYVFVSLHVVPFRNQSELKGDQVRKSMQNFIPFDRCKN